MKRNYLFWNLFWKSESNPFELGRRKKKIPQPQPPFKRVLLSSLTKTRGHNSCCEILMQVLHSYRQTEWTGQLSVAQDQADGTMPTLPAKLRSKSAHKAIFAGYMKRLFLLSAWVHRDRLSLRYMWYSQSHSKDRTFRDTNR